MKFIANFLKRARELERSCQLNSWRPFLLAEAIFFQRKALLLVETMFFFAETIPFSTSHFFQWKLFLLVKPFFFFFFFLFHLMEAASFSESCFFQWKSFLLVEPNGHIFVDSPSVRRQYSTWILRRDFNDFESQIPRENYDIDSTWKFRRGFDFQNRRNIDEFSTWIFLCRFEVELR